MMITNNNVVNELNPIPSIYRGNPSPEVDAAWDGLEKQTRFVISEKEVIKLGKDPQVAVKAPEDWGKTGLPLFHWNNDYENWWTKGFGSNGYLAFLDTPHLMHCLNTLRRYSIYFYEHYHGNETKPMEIHLTHCLEAIRSHLECKFDTDVITFYWGENDLHPLPDFNDVSRKCMDYNAVLNFNPDKQFTTDMYLAIEKPQGVMTAPDTEIV
jgi:hypothetical protein